MERSKYLIIFGSCVFIYVLIIIVFSSQDRKTASFHVSPGSILYHKIVKSHIRTYDNVSSCTPRTKTKSQMKFYKLSSNDSYHYEYRYELNNHNVSSNESRLILLLTSRDRVCNDWWKLYTGENILSQMRSSGFSILAICTPRKDYHISMPIQENLDVYWIYTTLQMWINDIYYKHFRHYPRLYLFGVSRGSQLCSLLCRVLPIQAQILYIDPGLRSGLLIHSDHDKAMQNRLIIDYQFANWFYFDYCFKAKLTTNKRCPFQHQNKNYFNPVPPTYFVHLKNDPLFNLSTYNDIISDLNKDAFNLGGTLLTHNNTVKLYVTYPFNITSDYMKENYKEWSCKPWTSRLFYEHFQNSIYDVHNKTLRTCGCSPRNYPNITETWSKTKQAEYRDYVNYFKRLKVDLCQIICGEILAKHAMSSQHIDRTLDWLNDMDHHRSLYKIQDFIHRPLRLWMYDKSKLVRNIKYLTNQTSMKTSCGRENASHQMYSPEYFLQDYFQRLNQSYPFSRHNLIWAKDPLLADYYIIPHDYCCFVVEHFWPVMTNSELKSLYNRLNQEYFLPLVNNIRTLFPYWSMTLGSNHIIAFTIGKNMNMIRNSLIVDSLKHVIQLGFTGYRQDLLPHDSPPLYYYKNGTPLYRHNYDIIIPPFNRIKWVNDTPLTDKSDLNMWYTKKKYLFFFAGTINHSYPLQPIRRRLASLINEDIGEGKIYEEIITIDRKQLNTIKLFDGHISTDDYAEFIRSAIFHLCPEGFSPWSPRIYESISLSAIPLIIAESIVLPFERFIDWRSFSTKINASNVRNIINIVMKINNFEGYVEQKLKNAGTYFHAFRWPYSPVNENHDRHLFLPEEDLNGKVKNVFHYLSLELRCRKLEQLYGLTSDSFSIQSKNAKREACRKHPTICPCDLEQKILSLEEFL